MTSVTGSDHIGQPIRDHLNAHVQITTTLLEESCQDLLSLSVLIPSAPWVRSWIVGLLNGDAAPKNNVNISSFSRNAI